MQKGEGLLTQTSTVSVCVHLAVFSSICFPWFDLMCLILFTGIYLFVHTSFCLSVYYEFVVCEHRDACEQVHATQCFSETFYVGLAGSRY